MCHHGSVVKSVVALCYRLKGALFRKSIEEDYQPPKEYLDHQNRRDREQKEKDKQERWLKHREEMMKKFDNHKNKEENEDMLPLLLNPAYYPYFFPTNP